MATLDKHLANIRQVWLDEPLPGRPSLRYLWSLLLAEVQNGINQITNTSQNWRTGEARLTFDPGIDEILVNAPGMSKPLLVYTEDESNAHHYERPIDIVSRQNLITGYEGARDGSGQVMLADNSWHTAQKIAIYRKSAEGDVWYASVRPITPTSGQSAIYRLIYADGAWAENASLGSQPVLTEHGHLFECRAAQLALSQAAWWADDDGKNAAKRQEKAMSLLAAEQRFGPMWDRYVASLSGRRVTFKASNW